MMKVLVTGAAGMLGTDLCLAFRRRFSVIGADNRIAEASPVLLHRLDLTDRALTLDLFSRERPQIVFHAAAMTNVDRCETEPGRAHEANVEMTKHVVEAANQAGAFLVFFSSDYVFDGKSKSEYTEEDKPSPCNVYGSTKRDAEEWIRSHAKQYLILRISWLFGLSGTSFPRTILDRAGSADSFEIVEDQIGRPTYTKDVAFALEELFSKDPSNYPIINQQIFHLSNSGATSWADYAEWILEHSHGRRPAVRRILTPEGHRPALRPKFSVLSTKKAESKLGIRLRSWQDAARDFIQAYESETKNVATK